MKKRFMVIGLMVVAVLLLLVGCLYWLPMHSQRPGTNRDALGTSDTFGDFPSDTTAQPLIAIARLGSFNDMQALRQSERYRKLCVAEPALAAIDHAEVDLGEGDWWYIKPMEEHLSMAINEYTFDMFMGTQSEDEARILLRTEEAAPMIIRMSAYDPGSVKFILVANDGRTLTWIPTETPDGGELRLVPEVAIIPAAQGDTQGRLVEQNTDWNLFFESFLNLLKDPNTESATQCGLSLVYQDEYEPDDGDAGMYAVVYGRGIERGKKVDFGYELRAVSGHACYFN